MLEMYFCVFLKKIIYVLYWKNTSEVTQSCPTLCNPMDCSLPGSSVHGIFQARVLVWVAIFFPGYLPNQGLNPGLLHCRQTHYHLSHQGSSHYTDSLALFTKFFTDVLVMYVQSEPSGHMTSCIGWKCNINLKNYKAAVRKGPFFFKDWLHLPVLRRSV